MLRSEFWHITMGTTFCLIVINNSSWGQHGSHLGPVGPSWAPCWPHELCYQGIRCIVTPNIQCIPWNMLMVWLCFIIFILRVPDGFMCTSWWRHQMETFSALLALWQGNPPVTGGFPSQRPVMRNFHVFFDLRLKKRLNKQSRHRWFETPSHPLWRHCIDILQSCFTGAGPIIRLSWRHWSNHEVYGKHHLITVTS